MLRNYQGLQKQDYISAISLSDPTMLFAFRNGSALRRLLKPPNGVRSQMKFKSILRNIFMNSFYYSRPYCSIVMTCNYASSTHFGSPKFKVFLARFIAMICIDESKVQCATISWAGYPCYKDYKDCNESIAIYCLDFLEHELWKLAFIYIYLRHYLINLNWLVYSWYLTQLALSMWEEQVYEQVLAQQHLLSVDTYPVDSTSKGSRSTKARAQARHMSKACECYSMTNKNHKKKSKTFQYHGNLRYPPPNLPPLILGLIKGLLTIGFP